jgi:pyruvate/2-oxoglutarate dehydrogenase complex dihydrolipoamide acyltransferase (E2) component
MAHEVIMPALGMAQDTGQIVAWLKKPGDAVRIGDALMEVETDKATMEVEAAADGFLTRVRAEAGASVPVGEVVATIADTAEPEAEPPAAAPAPAAVPADAAWSTPSGSPKHMMASAPTASAWNCRWPVQKRSSSRQISLSSVMVVLRFIAVNRAARDPLPRHPGPADLPPGARPG